MKDQGSPASATSTTSTEPSPNDKKPDAPAPTGAPTAYTDFKVPDGASIDKAAIERATPVFRELGLSQDQAQKLIDIQAQMAADTAKQMNDNVERMRNEWREAVTKDTEMAGKLDSVKEVIGRAKDLLPPGLRTEFDNVMNETGIGDHPIFVKALWKLSQMVTEGKSVTGGGPSPHGQSQSGKNSRPSLAGAMYPNLPQ